MKRKRTSSLAVHYLWKELRKLLKRVQSKHPKNSAFGSTGLGLLVFTEIIHSYAAADEMVELSLFDGSNNCYFHSGKQGQQQKFWGTRMVKYGDVDTRKGVGEAKRLAATTRLQN